MLPPLSLEIQGREQGSRQGLVGGAQEEGSRLELPPGSLGLKVQRLLLSHS